MAVRRSTPKRLAAALVMATWAAPSSAVPHSVPGLMDRLQQGPHVALVITRVNGYCAESERTYFTAPPSAACRKMFLAMVEARRIAFSMIRHGLPCHDLDARVNEFLRREGFESEDQRLHRTGHGIGLETHERPWVAGGSDDRLAENMVISIEPGIYIEGVGGVRHSDTVLVTRDGDEVLTNVPNELETLVIRRPRLAARMRGYVVRRALGSDRKR